MAYQLTPRPDGFALSGQISLQEANAVLAAGLTLLQRQQLAGPTLMGDLSGLTQSNSVTLAVLLQWYRYLATQGIRLQLTGVPQRLRAIMGASSLDTLLITPA